MAETPEHDRDRANRLSRGTYIRKAAEIVLFAAAFFAIGFAYARAFPKKDDALAPVRKVMETVRAEYYYYDENTERALTEGALKGIAAYLTDTYAAYYTEEEYAALMKGDSGQYTGLGITITLTEEGACLIESVFEGGPAYEAGLLAGDIITVVNGQSTAGLTLGEISGRILTDDGAENTLTVQRGEESLTFTVTAGEVYTPYVHYRMLNADTGYIHISGFHGKVTEEVETAVETLRAQGMDRLVLDVRDDPGGLLTDVCDIADIFLPADCVITTLKSRSGREKVYRTKTDGLGIPVAMLVNEDSASASELLAGALHDNGAAVLFGTGTYGKGIVQTYYELDRGANGAFKMTTDAYFTPGGVCIQDEGITPDHTVEMPEDVRYTEIWELDPASDPQLSAAIDYLAGL